MRKGFAVGTLLLFVVGCSGTSGDKQCRGDFCVETRDGMIMMEGDIIVGEAGAARGALATSTTVTGTRWPNARVPYKIDPRLPNPERIYEAIAHYQERTKLRFIPRTTQTAYVLFRPWAQGYCRSWIGRTGSAQAVDLDPVCDTRSVIHEIGHAVGFWHEHTRRDRNQYVKVLKENVISGLESNLAVQSTNVMRIGPYDFLSVMHYRPYELSRNGQPVLTKLDGSIEGLSNPDGLSVLDVAALRAMYP